MLQACLKCFTYIFSLDDHSYFTRKILLICTSYKEAILPACANYHMHFCSFWGSTIHGTGQRRKGSERLSDFSKVTELEPGSWSSSLVQGEESNICLDRCRSLWCWAWWEAGHLLIWLLCLNHLSFHLAPQGSRRDGSSWGNLELSIPLCGGQGRGCLILMLRLFAFFWGKGHFVVRQASLLELRVDSEVE